MRSKLFLGLVLGGVSFAGLIAACGDGSSDTGGTGGGSTSTGTSSPTSGPTTGPTTSSSSGPTTTSSTGSGGGNHSFATAADIMLNDTNPTAGTLSDPTMSKDYYKFTGTKGEAIGIFIGAKTVASMDPFDPAVVDVVVTLYDDKQTQIAFQDDPWPRLSNDPTLFTVLPADGTYYVMVQDCNSWMSGSCYDPSMITIFDYQLSVGDLGGPGDIKEAPEPNDTTTTGMVIPYTPDAMGAYGILLLDGAYKDNADVDVYSFMLPADVNMAMGARVHADFWLQTAGADLGNGATNPIGNVWVTDASGAVTLASVDGTKYGDVDNPMNGPANLSVPVSVGTQYYIFVQHGAGAAGANDFYFLQHFGGTFYANPVETAEVANDVPATAEPLTVQDNGDGSFSYFSEGDIISPTDVDHFAMDVPAGTTTVSAFCSAQRDGSGLRGFTFAIVNSDGTAITGASATEAPDSDVSVDKATLPNGAAQVLLKLSATSQDPTVTGTYYRCGVVFQP